MYRNINALSKEPTQVAKQLKLKKEGEEKVEGYIFHSNTSLKFHNIFLPDTQSLKMSCFISFEQPTLR